MKVFWSWQSDTPGKTGRHFVRGCLQAAVDALNRERAEASELEEPAEREAIELDHDRKGVKGSPGLADTIYAKIRAAAVVVCDVTPVVELDAGEGRVKKLTNPNVAIELGYAQGVRGDERVLMVLNLTHGRHEDLAFDLRHKTGILTYALADDSDAAAINAEAKRFTALLVEALRPYAQEPAAPAAPPAPFVRAESTTDPARWWNSGEVIGRTRNGLELPGPEGPLLYMRLAPLVSVPKVRSIALRERVFDFIALDGGNINYDRNRFGLVITSHVGGEDGEQLEVWGAVQIFETNEVWAFDGYLPAVRRSGQPHLPISAMEVELARWLRMLGPAMYQTLSVPLPLFAEIGLAPAMEMRIARTGKNWYSGRASSDKCFDKAIVCSAELFSVDDAAIDACLLLLLERFWDRFGERRPADMPIGGYR